MKGGGNPQRGTFKTCNVSSCGTVLDNKTSFQKNILATLGGCVIQEELKKTGKKHVTDMTQNYFILQLNSLNFVRCFSKEKRSFFFQLDLLRQQRGTFLKSKTNSCASLLM